MREIREELDAEVEVGELIDTIEYDYPEFHLSMQCYLCSLNKGSRIRLNEAAEARWLTAETIERVDWLPADLGLVKKLKKLID